MQNKYIWFGIFIFIFLSIIILIITLEAFTYITDLIVSLYDIIDDKWFTMGNGPTPFSTPLLCLIAFK